MTLRPSGADEPSTAADRGAENYRRWPQAATAHTPPARVPNVGIDSSELTAYWSAVAAVAPVLAIALVLEVRSLGRKWHARETTFERRWSLLGIVAAFVAGVGLIMSGQLALENLAGDTSQAPETAALWAGICLYTAAVIVISLPIGEVIGLVAAASAPEWGRKRQYAQLTDSVRAARRQIRSGLLEMLSVKADVLTIASRIDREGVTDEEVHGIATRGTAMMPKVDSSIAKLREMDRDLAKLERKIARRLKRIEAGKRDKAFDKVLRARFDELVSR